MMLWACVYGCGLGWVGINVCGMDTAGMMIIRIAVYYTGGRHEHKRLAYSVCTSWYY